MYYHYARCGIKILLVNQNSPLIHFASPHPTRNISYRNIFDFPLSDLRFFVLLLLNFVNNFCLSGQFSHLNHFLLTLYNSGFMGFIRVS